VNWLNNARAAAKRYQDPGLSALLVAQALLIFVAEPLAFEGFEPPLIAIGIIVAGLILLLAFGSDQRGALIVVGVAGLVRLLTAAADLIWGAPVEAAEGISAVLGLLAMMWAVFEIVFGPGRITAHRVSCDRYYFRLDLQADRLRRSCRFFWPQIRRGPAWRIEPFSLLQPDIADHAGTRRHHAGQRVRAEPDRARGAAGQLFPAVVLARILTLYTDDKHREDARSEQTSLSETGA
jgi:hypothetical protein